MKGFPIKFDTGLFVNAIVVHDEATEVRPGRFWAADDTLRTCVFGVVPFAVIILVVARLRAAISTLDSFCRVVAAVVCAVRSSRAKTAVSGRKNEVVLVPNLNVTVFLTVEDVETGRRCTLAVVGGRSEFVFILGASFDLITGVLGLSRRGKRWNISSSSKTHLRNES